MIPPESVFYQFAETSLRVSCVIVVMLALRPWLRRFIGSQWLCVLWLIVLGRLLAPVSIVAPWSIGGFQMLQLTQLSSESQPAARFAMSSGASDLRWKARITESTNRADSVISPDRGTEYGDISVPSVLFAIWVTGVFVGLIGLTVRLRQTRYLVAQTCPATDPQLLEVFESINPKLRGNVGLRMTSVVSIPTLAGLRRPQIWVPESWMKKLSSDELRHVLLHELGHARRRDLLVQRLFLVAQCLHWFNPLVWIAARLAKEDREMACDAWVLDRSDADDSPAYGLTLLKIVKLLRDPVRISPVLIEMATSKKDLTVRVRAIGAFRRVPPWPGMLLVITAAATLAVVTTTAQTVSGKSDAAPVSGEQSRPLISASPGNVNDPESDEGLRVELETTLVEAPLSTWERLKKDGFDFEFHEPVQDGKAQVAVTLSSASRDVHLRALSKVPDVTVSRAEKIVATPGKSMVISFPKKDGKERGLSIVSQAQVGPDQETIDLQLIPEEGFTRHITAAASILTGQTLLLWHSEKPSPGAPSNLPESTGQRIFVTARIIGKPTKPPIPSPPQVEVSSKFIELTDEAVKELQLEMLLRVAGSEVNSPILDEAQFNELVRAINSKRGSDLVSAPRVTTKSGQRAVIEIIRELRDPAAWEKDPQKPGAWVVKEWETRNTGVTLEVEPKVNPNGTVAMDIKPQVVEALGFVDLETGKPALGHRRQIKPENRESSTKIDQMLFDKGTGANSLYDRTIAPPDFSAYRFVPGHRNNAVFSTRSAQRNVELKPGQSIVMLLKETEDTKPFEAEAPKRPLIAIVTAKIFDPKKQ